MNKLIHSGQWTFNQHLFHGRQHLAMSLCTVELSTHYTTADMIQVWPWYNTQLQYIPVAVISDNGLH